MRTMDFGWFTFGRCAVRLIVTSATIAKLNWKWFAMNGVYFHQISNNQALATHIIIGVSISEAIFLHFYQQITECRTILPAKELYSRWLWAILRTLKTISYSQYCLKPNSTFDDHSKWINLYEYSIINVRNVRERYVLNLEQQLYWQRTHFENNILRVNFVAKFLWD